MLKILESAKRLYALKQNLQMPSYRRFLFDDLLLSTSKIVGIYGSRGVGKTTILLQLLDVSKVKQSQKLYISCDHPIFKTVSLFDFVDEFSKKGGELLVIDEIHEAQDFQDQLKSIYDFLDIKIYFSGSSAIEITNADFARRYSMYNLPVLSFKEYLELTQNILLDAYPLEEIFLNHEDITHNIMSKLNDKKILKYYNEFLHVGVYPFYFEDTLKANDCIT